MGPQELQTPIHQFEGLKFHARASGAIEVEDERESRCPELGCLWLAVLEPAHVYLCSEVMR